MKKSPIILAIILGIISFSCKKKNEVKPSISYHKFENNNYVSQEALTNFNIVNTSLVGNTAYYVFNSVGDSVEVYYYSLDNYYRQNIRYKEIKLISLTKRHASLYKYIESNGIVIYNKSGVDYNYYPVETIN